MSLDLIIHSFLLKKKTKNKQNTQTQKKVKLVGQKFVAS